MKLVYYPLSLTIEIKLGGINFITVEEKKLFNKIVDEINDCLCGLNESISLDEISYKDFIKQSSTIFSPKCLTFSDSGSQKQVLTLVKNEFIEGNYEYKYAELNSEIVKLIDNVSNNINLPLDFEDEYSFMELVKKYNIRAKEPEGSFLEKLYDFCNVMFHLLEKRFFFIFACDSYIDENDYEQLNTLAEYLEISLIFMNSRLPEGAHNYNSFILDKDLCIIK